MASDLGEDKILIEKLQIALNENSSQHHREISELIVLNNASVTAIKDIVTQQQEECVRKDKDIESLRSNLLNLQSNIEAKGSIITSLHKSVNQCNSNLKEEQKKSNSLQRDYNAAVSQQKKEAEELARMTQGNQHLASENKRLQNELEAAFTKQHIEENKLQGRVEEAIKKEEACFSRASKKIESQEKELSEKTLALEKNLAVEKHLRAALKSEKKRFEKMVGKQPAAGHLSITSKQLREEFACNMQTVRRENADIRAKFLVLEGEYDRKTSELGSLSVLHEETLSRKNSIISESQLTITKLQCMVNEFKAKESKSKKGQVDFEESLKQEKMRNSELHQSVDQISSSLEIERTRCEKHRVELKEALTKQIKLLEENYKFRIQEKQRAETNSNFRNISDSDLSHSEQKSSLGESNKALYHLQQEYTYLGRRHCDINADYRELLKTHTTLQVRHERLSYAQGNQCLDFSPHLFQ
ncbi:centrosomal protein of 63 kDa-like [Eleginops maclovinus]|uniref:centrosomal protein of 63 kDa-like n=1 Tax=Eleginops maclovinus TaxID=56733 RepID=UPI003080F662